jgi:ferric iron reductase protein FhuF
MDKRPHTRIDDPTGALIRMLADISAVSGYFHLDTGSGDVSWQPLTSLFADHEAFADRVTTAADLLGTRERRVAASILHLGIAARLWSPYLGTAVVHDTLLDWTADTLHFKPAPSGPLPLRLLFPAARPATDTTTPDMATSVYIAMEPLLTALNDLVRATVKIAPGLLWGNTASALGGAVHTLTRQRPAHSSKAVALGATLLGHGRLRGLGHFTEPAPGRPFFTRTTCCLYYRIPGAGTCGDCALLTPQARQARWTRALQETS